MLNVKKYLIKENLFYSRTLYSVDLKTEYCVEKLFLLAPPNKMQRPYFPNEIIRLGTS